MIYNNKVWNQKVTRCLRSKNGTTKQRYGA
jgi:hypothetical protein